MRVGQNPNRNSPAHHQSLINFAVVTHLPELIGYHEHRLEVVKLCLTSMRDNAHIGANIIVWDNESCDELRDWLRLEYKPDILILSENIGKAAVKTNIIRMLPPEALLSFSDDDVLFERGWFMPQLVILQSFPNVACVTGYACRAMMHRNNEKTLAWCRENAKLEEGQFLSEQENRDYCKSVGLDWEYFQKKHEKSTDYKVSYNNAEAYATSHHCQLLGYTDRLIKATRYDGLAMGPEDIWDSALDSVGLRLATTKRLTRHIGNYLDPLLRKEIDDGR